MAVQKKKESQKTNEGITFKAGFDGVPDKDLEVAGYLFDAQGKLIAISPAQNGQARFTVTESKLKRARVFFGPQIPEGRKKEKISIQSMKRLMAYEPSWKFEPGKRVYEVLPIAEVHWPWWLWCKCRVNGRVLKRLYSGGVTYEAPVCGARVHI